MPSSPRTLPARLVTALTLLTIALAPLPLSAGWTLVWSDEFTQPDQSLPDNSIWGYDRGGWGWGNWEEQFYTNPLAPDFDTPNAFIENNQLVIEVRDDSGLDGSPNLYTGNSYTSARLLTKDKFERAYGRIEARVKVPEGGAGIWPAFWSLGAGFPNVPWPNCGEIDIMEYVSREPNEVFGTLHGPGYSGGSAFGNIYNLGEPVVNDYHIFAVEWEVDQIRWFIDDVLYHTATPADVAPNEWVYNQEFFLILNVAMGGTFGGAVDRNNINFPLRMLVDYVRVYEDDGIPDSIDVPAIVQMEDYTTQSGVIFESTTDTGGGANAGFLSDGDYLEFLLNSPSADTYSIDLRVSSGTTMAGSVTITADGKSVTSGTISNTGGWQTWTTVPVGNIALPAGLVNLRVTVNSPGPGQNVMNINWMDVKVAGATTPPLTLAMAGTFNDESGDGFADVGETVTYAFEITNTGTGNQNNISLASSSITVNGPATQSGPTNLLANAGFEEGLTSGWSANPSGGTVEVSTTSQRSGTQSLHIDSSGAPDWSSPHVFQSFPAVEDQEFNLQGYLFTESAVTSTAFGLLKIEFTDGSTILEPKSIVVGTGAAGPFYGAESTPRLNGDSTAGQWIWTEAQAVAPAGTTTVNLYVLNVNPPGNSWSFHYDDIMAFDVGDAPAPLNLLPGQVDNTTFTGTYTITEADINAGKIVATATVESDQSTPIEGTGVTLIEANPGVDTDGDSFNNIFERAYGLNIFEADSLANGPAGGLTEVDGQGHVSITYRRLAGGTGTTGVSYNADGYNYIVETASSLSPGSWQSGASFVEAVGDPIDNGDGTETVTVRASPPMTPGSKTFIRLNVTRTP